MIASAPPAPGAVLAHAVRAGFGLDVLLIAVVDQRVQAGNAFSPDIAALATIASVGTAEFDEFLAPERHTARAAIAGLHEHTCLIKELHDDLP
jgi:hypothetical protein